MVQCEPGWRELSNMFGKAGTVAKFVWISRVWTNGLLSYNAYVMTTYEIFLTQFTHNFTWQCNLRVYLAALECFERKLTTTSVRSEIWRKTVLLWLSLDVDSEWSSKGTHALEIRTMATYEFLFHENFVCAWNIFPSIFERGLFFSFFLHKVFFFFLFPFCDGKERTYKCTFSRNLLGRRTTSIFIYTRGTYDTLLSKKRLRAFYSFGDRCKHRFLFCREISWKQGLVENRRLLCNNLI